MGEMIMGLLLGAGLATMGKKVYRPALKGAIKAGITASEALQDAVHEGREQLSDLVAEARHEVETARAAAPAPDAPAEEPRGPAN